MWNSPLTLINLKHTVTIQLFIKMNQTKDNGDWGKRKLLLVWNISIDVLFGADYIKRGMSMTQE